MASLATITANGQNKTLVTRSKDSEIYILIRHSNNIAVPRTTDVKETYTVYEDENGDYVKHGKYSASCNFSRTLSANNQSMKSTVVYNSSATFKDGWLNGLVTITSNSTVVATDKTKNKVITDNEIVKITANFVDGVPHGAWRYTLHEGTVLKSYAYINFNKGTVTGAYDAKYPNNYGTSTLKGTITSNGRITKGEPGITLVNGVVTADTRRDHNDKLKNRFYASAETKRLALEYANGKMTEEQLKNFGIIVERDGEANLNDAYNLFNSSDLNRYLMGGDKSLIRNSNDKDAIELQCKAYSYVLRDQSNKFLSDDEYEYLMVYLGQKDAVSEEVKSRANLKVTSASKEKNNIYVYVTDLNTNTNLGYKEIKPKHFAVVDSILSIKLAAEKREKFVKDSIANAAKVAAAREKFVKDSIVQREKFVKDSVARVHIERFNMRDKEIEELCNKTNAGLHHVYSYIRKYGFKENNVSDEDKCKLQDNIFFLCTEARTAQRAVFIQKLSLQGDSRSKARYAIKNLDAFVVNEKRAIEEKAAKEQAKLEKKKK